MLTINLEFDPNALAAPQSFRNGVQAAANILEAAIYNPITVNIQVGYNEFDDNGPEFQVLTGAYSLGGDATLTQLAYPALRSALATTETSGTDAEVVNALPNTASLNGQSNFDISSAQAKALGVIPGLDSAVDGFIGFPSDFTGNGLVDAAIVEEAHALGLLNADGDLGLVSYTSPGTHFLPTGPTATTPAYYSVDGGNTDLANYDISFDETLFLNQPNDPIADPNNAITALSALDLTELDAIGFDTTSTPVTPTPSAVATIATVGTASITAQNVSVAENGSTPVLSFLKSVAVPSATTLASYGFEDQGGGGGHLSLNGVIEPDNKFIYVLDTQLSSLLYVGGSSPGVDSISITGFDYDTRTFTQASRAAAVTTSAVATGPATPSTYSIQANDAGNPQATPDGTSGTTPYTFTVSRTGDVSQASTLNYTATGSGTNPAPASLFQNPTGSVTLAAGASSSVVTINVNGASIARAEGFVVTLSGGNGPIAVPVAADTIGANAPPLDPGAIALNATAIYAFANTGVPSFTAVVNQDGSADLAKGASTVTGSFIGGYVAGIEIRVMANLEQTGGSTASIDAQFGRDMDSISSLLAPGNVAEGFGFLSGLTTGGPTGLTGGAVPAALQTDIRTALGSDQQATVAVAGCIVGAVNFAQGYINGINAGLQPIAALRSIETAGLQS